MGKIATFLLGAFAVLCLIGFVASGEDRVIAEKCDYAGKVKLNDIVYECAPLTTHTERK